jgi:hypothetical protein
MAFKIEKKNLGLNSYNSCQATLSANSSLTIIVARTNTKKKLKKKLNGLKSKNGLKPKLGLGFL